jgi:hypothetical protein
MAQKKAMQVYPEISCSLSSIQREDDMGNTSVYGVKAIKLFFFLTDAQSK